MRSLERLPLAIASLLLSGCASQFLAHEPPGEPYDAVVVMGCPSEENGAPSHCQLGRAGQAALVWKQGWAKNFIVTGAAAHTPYVEAEAIAQAMVVLGVPPERIILETEALHTDENAYFSMVLARRMGLEKVAVASVGGHAAFACRMMLRWGHACVGLAMDEAELERFLPPYERTLQALRAPRVVDWVALDEQEARLRAKTGRSRPSSIVLYTALALGSGWVPRPPSDDKPVRYSDRRASLVMGALAQPE